MRPCDCCAIRDTVGDTIGIDGGIDIEGNGLSGSEDVLPRALWRLHNRDVCLDLHGIASRYILGQWCISGIAVAAISVERRGPCMTIEVVVGEAFQVLWTFGRACVVEDFASWQVDRTGNRQLVAKKVCGRLIRLYNRAWILQRYMPIENIRPCVIEVVPEYLTTLRLIDNGEGWTEQDDCKRQDGSDLHTACGDTAHP